MGDVGAPTLLNDRTLRVVKEAVRNVFWKREEFRKLFERSGVPSYLIAEVRQDSKTWAIVDVVLDALNVNALYHMVLNELIKQTLHYRDGKHLGWAGPERVIAADESLARLRSEVGELADDRKKAEQQAQERETRLREAKRGQLFHSKLEELREKFYAWHSESGTQVRGLKFEVFLAELFDLFDLAPKGSFRRNGEQIDGAFCLDSDNFLMEAKWQKAPVDLNDLRDLDSAVKSTLETTLGVFISVSGFSPNSLENLIRGIRPSLICVDASDLICVLDGRIGLDTLLKRKKHVAAQRRIVFASASDLLGGKY